MAAMTPPAPAPELTHALTWVNSDPLRLAELRGRVVVLWFWHGASALCHNVLDDLRQLQARHGAALCLVGIHTPKYDGERDPRQVLKLVNRLGIRFPVASDADFVAWQHYGMAGWPATLLIDRQGSVRKVVAGDLRREELEAAAEALLREPTGDSVLDEPFRPAQHPEPRQALAFPSGLAVTPAHLYIADTAHHRILECAHDGRVLRQFGSGNPGFVDGSSADASFASPRGLAVWKDTLFVADAGNHALRRVQLAHGEVDTVAGNGKPGIADAAAGIEPGTCPLNAPWDVAASHDHLYLAMAGSQQVWAFDINRRQLRPLAGCGRLGLADGPADHAAFGQPAALALVQHTLYVADCGGSAIRTVHTGDGGVQTLIGQDLFEFGDADGTRSAARLQAPMGLALDPRSPILWIADTFNHSLRMLRLGGGDLRRFELDYRLQEPTALAASEGALWLANSAAHEVLRIEPDSGSVQRLPVGE